jgi:hypothetical protein
MKKIKNLIFLKIVLIITFTNSTVFAQQIDIEKKYSDGFSDIEGAYYSDFNQIFNNFEGEWFYTTTNQNGSITSIRLKIKKAYNIADQFFPDNINYTTDALLVSFQLIQNGIEEFNTLNGFDQLNSISQTNFYGDLIIGNIYKPICGNCTTNEKRVEFFYSEPNNDDFYLNIIMRRSINSNNIPIIEMKVYGEGIAILTPDKPNPDRLIFKKGDYVLVKQP